MRLNGNRVGGNITVQFAEDAPSTAVIYTLYTDEDESLKIVDFDWYSLLEAVSSKHQVILVDSTLQSGNVDPYGNYYYLTRCYTEDGYLVFMTADDVRQNYLHVTRSGTIREYVRDSLSLDPSLEYSSCAAPASVVGEKLGNIETALDHIIAIQESLIGGASE